MSDSSTKPGVPREDPLDVIPRLLTKLYSLWISFSYPFATRGHKLSVHYTALLSRTIAPRIRLGNFVIIRRNAWINIIPEAKGETNIHLDDNCCINSQCLISAKNSIVVGRGVMVSSCVLIMDHNHAFEDVDRPIRDQGPTNGGTINIEEGCWIGYGAAIVCNEGELVIGRNSVIAANALVTRSFPPYSVIVGNPARLARQYDPEKGLWTGGGRPSPSDTAK